MDWVGRRSRNPGEPSRVSGRVLSRFESVPIRLDHKAIILKGLILAQNERWRRGLGMQVEREAFFGRWTAANGVVRHR